jgi:superfamily II DNA or RNA helicase
MAILTSVGVLMEYQLMLKKVGMDGIRQIKKIFTIKTPGFNNTIKQISSFKLVNITNKEFIIIPRFGGFMLQSVGLITEVLKNKLKSGEDRQLTMSNTIFTNNQKIIISHLEQNIFTEENKLNGKSSTILQMDPGYGKTYIAVGLINKIQKKTFIVVPNTYLLKQWVDVLTKCFPQNTIGYYYGAKKLDGDIIVSIINSALTYPDYSACGLIVYDEVHMYCSTAFAEIFTKAQCINCIGITATPVNRIDKFDKIAHWALGKVIYANKVDGWNQGDISFKSNVVRVIYNGPESHTKILESASGIVSVPLMVNQLCEDPYRNQLIVNYALKLHAAGSNVFIFSDRREHLKILSDLLNSHKITHEVPELEPLTKTKTKTKTKAKASSKTKTQKENPKYIKDMKVFKLIGGSSNLDIENANTNGRIIMTTYQYSGTGVSINKMNALILATPRKSNMTQILGRIYRLSGDQTILRHIIDIVDNKTCLKSQYYVRKKSFMLLLNGKEIVDKKIKHGDDISNLGLD